MPFTCSICGEESTRICARCTKDACNNHLCDKCRRCSDCCECEVALDEPVHEAPAASVAAPAAVEAAEPEPVSEPELEPEPEPEPPAAGDPATPPSSEL